MLRLTQGWQWAIDESPEWLFVRLRHADCPSPATEDLAEAMWSVAAERRIVRLVIELEESSLLGSALVGQLVILHKRAHLADGVVRLCGLTEDHYRVIETLRLGDRFPNYPDREAAVMGYRPRKPR